MSGVWDTVGALGLPVHALNRRFIKQHQFHDVQLSSWVDNAFHAIALDERRKSFAPTLWEPQNVPGQTVEQVWFPGVHSNIGGGYPDSKLSDGPLLWMIERAESCGLEFDQRYLSEVLKPLPACDGKLYNSLSLWYRPFGSIIRSIADQHFDQNWKLIDTKESIHPSAIERYRKLTERPHGPYGLPNLVEYLDQHQPQAADATYDGYARAVGHTT